MFITFSVLVGITLCRSAIAGVSLLAWINGNAYHRLDETNKRSYVVGVTEGLVYATSSLQEDIYRRMGACLEGVTTGQLQAMVDKWIEAHPEQWDRAAADLVYTALQNACIARRHPLVDK
jgi:hypothetical protein